MNTTLITQSRRYYSRFYRLVVLAVIVMMAVLTGSLLLGDSVKGTLTDRVYERLGNTETIISSGTGFLQEEIMQSELLAHSRGYLLMQGFVSDDQRYIPVYVWGSDHDSIGYGSAVINQPLANQLHGAEDIVLHLPSHNLVPSGSLFVTKSYATQLRLHIDGIKSVAQGGNLLLKNEQTLPLNIFVNREELGEIMELEHRINLILSESFINEEQFASIWHPSLSGLHVNEGTVTTDRIFLSDNIVSKYQTKNIYFSYLVNDLTHRNDSVPYSFVTAVSNWQGRNLKDQEMILSDYAAARLHVHAGDTVQMSYFLSRNLKNLSTTEQAFVVADIVPLAQLMADPLLSAQFPGLSNVEKCTDWDSDLPIEMNRIHKIDEDYWYDYHQTPKALVAYESVVGDWTNTMGTATALSFDRDAEATLITPGDCQIAIHSPKASGLYAATHGTDFASLFLALAFFIILSAILLMLNPLAEMFSLRQSETELYSQLGFTRKEIRKMYFQEAFSVALVASPVGVLAGILYTGATLWLLGNVWSGATHTEGFSLHIHLSTLAIGWIIGLVIIALSLYYLISKTIRKS